MTTDKSKRLELYILADLSTGEVHIQGPLELKTPVINTLAAAIQIVVHHQPPSRAPLAPAVVEPKLLWPPPGPKPN